MKAMYKRIYSELKNGHDVVLASIIKSEGSTPRKEGAKMAYFEDDSTLGTVGGGKIEFDCTNICKDINSATAPFTKEYILDHNEAKNIGMVCGGKTTVFFQYINSDEYSIALFEKINKAFEKGEQAFLITSLKNGEVGIYEKDNGLFNLSLDFDIAPYLKTTPKISENQSYFFEPLSKSEFVYIFGGGHISQALCRMLSLTDFNVIVYENNEKFSDIRLFDGAKRVVKADFTEINENINITHNDYCVVLTRGHESDNEVLSQILSKHPSYLGVIGSKKKVTFMKEYLLSCGFSKEDIEKIHSPIGLSIGAVTPAEIAVSITAELIRHRSSNR
ncbi:MAG: XdhC family protein [Ruminococcus sp.]|nr:XdhC family protein [Ruminococcus sp.]